jgi:streptogramin lyase
VSPDNVHETGVSRRWTVWILHRGRRGEQSSELEEDLVTERIRVFCTLQGASFAVAAGHVWFIEERGALYGLNLDTLEVDQSVSGFDWPAGGFPDPSTELDPGQLAVWVTNSDQDSMTRIDLAAPGSIANNT